MTDQVKPFPRFLRIRPRLPLPQFLFPPLSFLILCALCASLFLQGIASRELWASHEARAAQNSQRMLDDGNWLLPRLYDGQVELQKPTGFYWLVAVVGWMRGGVDPVAVRLPAVLAGTLTAVLVWSHLRRRGRPVAAFIAAAMLAGAVHFTGTARIGRIDVPLACVVTAIMLVSRDALAERGARARGELLVVAWARAPRSASASRLTAVRIGTLAGIALMLKGPIGVVLPVAAFGAFVVVERLPIRRALLTGSIAGAVAFGIAFPWYLWANAATDGEFFRVFFLYHHFNRAFGGAEALAGHPWWFYLPRFANDFLPWTPLLLIALVLRRWRGDSDGRFGLVWFAVMLAALSCSRFKRADYLLPAYAGAAIFVGCAAERWYLSRTARAQRVATCGFAATLALLPAWWIAFDQVVTAKDEAAHAQAPFAHQIRDLAPVPEPVLLFRVESHLLAYHLGRPVHTLVEWSDLDDWIQPDGPHFVIVRAESLEELRQHVAGAEIIARTDNNSHRPLVLLRIDTHTWPTQPRD
jgi:4-amino-4-deoxy-L-arabinose transferase-like glycosyltransferase